MAQPSSQGRQGRGPAAPPSDEQLVRQAQDGSGAAATELNDRCAPAIDRQVLAWARGRLSPEDTDDARQEAAIAFLRAVARYDPPEGVADPPRFRTFLNSVVSSALSAWDRRRRRLELLFDRSAGGTPEPPGGATADPAALVQDMDDRAHLAAALCLQGAEHLFLWHRLLAGRPLTQVAAELDLSYSQARRLLRGVLAVVQHAFQ